VKVTLLPSSVTPGAEVNQYLTTFLIDDRVAIDAGSLGLLGSTEAQARVKHVFLTHTHIDHLASLPIFVENVFEAGESCPTFYGGPEVLDCLQRDFFNGRVWPDFIAMSRPESPFLKLEPLRPGRAVEVEGLKITAISVHHIVPTVGVVVEGPGASVVIAGDTGPTDALWRAANDAPNLKAVFLEAAFPDELEWLADASKHLTPGLFAGEVAKIKRGVPVYAIHIKPKFLDRVKQELAALGLGEVRVCLPGQTYEF
jgi:ribonuclease BN (tRNA processing enzyme)